MSRSGDRLTKAFELGEDRARGWRSTPRARSYHHRQTQPSYSRNGTLAGGASGMENMLGQLRDMQKKLEETRKQLAEETIEASSGRGAGRVIMSGTQEGRQVVIDPG